MRNSTLFVIILSSALLLGTACNKGDKKAVEIDTVQKRDLVEMVSANGKIQPETDVKISPEVSGKILEIKVKEGEAVKKGDLLMIINPDLLEASVSRAGAALNSSRASLANARARAAQAEAQFINTDKSYQRSKQLFDQGVLSEAEMDQIESNYQTALAEKAAAKESVAGAGYQVKSAEATRSEATDNLGRTSIYAPNDGIITALQVEEGETVLGTIQMAGTEVMRVSNLHVMEVDVEVNESDIVRVALGDTADVEVDAYQDKIFKGLVTEIANAATNASGMMSTDQVTNFSVKIRILESSYEDLLAADEKLVSPFRTGMSATVDIRTARKDNVVTVPIEAVTTRTDTSTADSFKERMEQRKKAKYENVDPIECVFIYSNGEAKLRTVKTGIQDNRYIEIISGLSEGDEIIKGPYATVSRELNNGTEVEEKSADEEED